MQECCCWTAWSEVSVLDGESGARVEHAVLTDAAAAVYDEALDLDEWHAVAAAAVVDDENE